jgi:hypothetical protein
MKRERKPSRLVAQPTPRPSYTKAHISYACKILECGKKYSLWTAKRGKTAPSVYLRIPFAAIADAPPDGPYTSIMYNAAEVCPKVSLAKVRRSEQVVTYK